MSGITETAQVKVDVDSKNAKQSIDSISAALANARAQLTKLKNDGADVKDYEKQRKEVQKLKKEFDNCVSSVEGIKDTLNNLDGSSIHEVQKAITQLGRALKNDVPGSDMWNEHSEQIQKLKARLKELNLDSAGKNSGWSKFTSWAKGWQTALVGLITHLGNIRDFFAKFVEDFAGMEQEMANVRKYTGMTGEEVASLNAEFKKIDTRSSREQLNQLAQEAGRLGKTSQEDVLGFVRAADKINVALDDLGSGATLTLSKLTGIFGDEARYGTEQSLLKVGSVINELSQNCSASAPYLAEFAERMGGVGAQAGLSIQQIMGFAAVLDSNAQKVEASSTAIAQVLTRIYTDPSKYAKVAGLNVAEFTKLVRTDANAALLQFLETLQKAGGMDTLAPMFKDMGETGSRAIAALSTLAAHINDVKAQQAAANKAFDEGTSIDTEFAVQNSTVQASLDKQKNAMHEVSVELGERLAPLYQVMITSTTAVMQGVTTFTRFLGEHKTMLISLASTIAAYTLAVNAATIAHRTYGVMLKLVDGVCTAFRATALLLKTAWYGVTLQTEAASASLKIFKAEMSTTGFGALIAVLSLVVGRLIEMRNAHKQAAEEARRHREELQQQRRAMRDVSSVAAQYCSEELTRLHQLYKVATDSLRPMNERLAAVKSMKQEYPKYLGGISDESLLTGQAASQYNSLAQSIRNVAKARAAESKMKENYGKIIDLELERDARQSERDTAQDKADTENDRLTRLNENRKSMKGAERLRQSEMIRLQSKNTAAARKAVDAKDAEIAALNNQINELEQANAEIEFLYNKTAPTTPTATPTPTPSAGNTPSGYTSATQAAKEKRKTELERKRALAKEKANYKAKMDEAKGTYEEASAENVSLYSSGLRSYEAYLAEKERLDKQYVDDQMAVYKSLYDGESESEKKLLLLYDEDYKALLLKASELNQKYADNNAKLKVDTLKQQYDDAVYAVQQRVNDPTNALHYDDAAAEEELFELKIKYLELYRDQYKHNRKVYDDYDRQIAQANQEHTLSLQKRYAQKYEEWRGKYSTLSAKTRQDMELAFLDAMHKAGYIKEEEYQKTRLALISKYAKEIADAQHAASTENYEYTGPDGSTIDARSADSQRDDTNAQRNNAKQRELDKVDERLAKGLITDQEAEAARKRIEYAYGQDILKQITSSLDDTTKLFVDFGATIANIGKMSWDSVGNCITNVGEIAQSTFALMTAGLQTYSEFAAAQSRIEIANTEKKYDAAIEAAQGNSYKTTKLEKQKEERVAALKAEASRKEFNIKVIEAIAQTAQNAIAAYGAGWQVGPAGVYLAPLFAGIATAAGMVQVALLRKQQQAAEAEGYAEGGFTKPGDKYEPAGVVHAGEWVASQQLLASPVARPLIDALDYAQRTNTIGSLRAEDVSRSITATDSLLRFTETDTTASLTVAAVAQSARAVSALTDRLNEPFVTVNTVTGNTGIKQAQDDYDQFVRNKTPKSRRK